jgi:hypothetical protein
VQAVLHTTSQDCISKQQSVSDIAGTLFTACTEWHGMARHSGSAVRLACKRECMHPAGYWRVWCNHSAGHISHTLLVTEAILGSSVQYSLPSAARPYSCASPCRAAPCHSVLSVKRVPAISDTLCCLEMQFWEVVCSTACTEQHSWVHALSLAGKSSCCL